MRRALLTGALLMPAVWPGPPPQLDRGPVWRSPRGEPGEEA
jgi:hypothetical protein